MTGIPSRPEAVSTWRHRQLNAGFGLHNRRLAHGWIEICSHCMSIVTAAVAPALMTSAALAGDMNVERSADPVTPAPAQRLQMRGAPIRR